MTKQEFVTNVKTQYPEYQDIDDEVLVQKLIQKYPVYQSQITDLNPPAKKVEKGIQTPSAVVGLGKSAVQGAVGLIRTGDAIARNTAGKVVEGITGRGLAPNPISSDQPTGQKLNEDLEADNLGESVGKTVGDVAQFFLPSGAGKGSAAKSILTKGASMLAPVARDVIVATNQASGSGEDVGQAAKTAALFSGALQGVGELAPPLTKLLGSQAKNLRVKNLRLTPTQKQSLGNKLDEAVSFLQKEGITGNPETQFAKVVQKYNEMEKKVVDLLEGSKKIYPAQEMVDFVNAIPGQYAQIFDNPEVYEQLVSKSDKLAKHIMSNFPEGIPAKNLNAFKRSYAKNARNKLGDQVTNEAREALADSLYTKLLDDVPELKAINKEYGPVITAKKLLGKSLGRNELGLIGNLVAISAGGAVGTALGGPVGAAIGAVAGPTIAKTVSGTAARTGAAKLLEKTTKGEGKGLKRLINR